jgi:preprotein translocase subunit SecD
VALGAAAALAGCSVTTTSTDPLASLSPTSASPSGAPATSGTAEEALDLQLRPVVSQRPAEADECTTAPAPTTPPPRQAATLCSSDRSTVYELKPAAVAGDRVTSIEPISSVDGPIIQVKYDAMGGSALRTVTLAGSLADPQPALAIVSQGVVLGAPTMSEEIDGGVLVISGFATLDQAKSAVAFIAR